MNGKRRQFLFQSIAWFFLILSILFVFYITLFTREQSIERKHIFDPLHSYVQIFSNQRYGWIKQNCLNILLFVPFGFSAAFKIRNRRVVGKQNIMMTSSAGFLLSLFVETTQFWGKLGYFETDDLIHNTIGAFLGASLFSAIARIFGKHVT